jgi:hypothetical protein
LTPFRLGNLFRHERVDSKAGRCLTDKMARDLEEAGSVRKHGLRAAQSTPRSRYVTPFDIMDYYD